MFKLIKLMIAVLFITVVAVCVKYKDVIFENSGSEKQNIPLKERVENNLKEVADSVGHKALEKGKDVIKKKVQAKVSLN